MKTERLKNYMYSNAMFWWSSGLWGNGNPLNQRSKAFVSYQVESNMVFRFSNDNGILGTKSLILLSKSIRKKAKIIDNSTINQ